MKRLLTCALASSLLAACASETCPPQPVQAVTHVVTQTVNVAVPVMCVTAIPKPRVPLSTSAQIYTQGSGYQVVMRYDRELNLRDSYEDDLVAALKGCMKGQVSPQTGSPAASGPPK
jgi:hypothetical protein